MVKGDDAFGSGAGKMRGGTFMVTMVSAPTVPTRACVGAVAAIVSWVLAVALEAIWVVLRLQVALRCDLHGLY